jgi:hypothetical protein
MEVICLSCHGYFIERQFRLELQAEQNRRLLSTVPSFCLSVTKGISLRAARRVCERAKHQSCFDCAREFVDTEVH